MEESKINIGNNKLTKEEIEANENFDQLLKKHQLGISRKRKLVGGGIVLGVFLIIAMIGLVTQKKEEPVVEEKQKEERGIATLMGVESVKETFVVNANEGGLFTYDNTIIEIPRNAFVDSVGNRIEGEVVVSYKEFHNPVDFIISGIPMTYDSAGVDYQFESAGMFDIRGSKDGVPVMLDKRIMVKLQSFQEGNYFNQYYFDEFSMSWKYISRDSAIRKPEGKQVDLSKLDKEIIEVKGLMVDIEKERPVLKKEGSVCIKLDMDFKEFPEFVGFKEVLFEIDDNDKNFNKSLSVEEWDDIKLKKESGVFELILYKKFKKTSIKSKPVFTVGNIEKALGVYRKENQRILDSLGKELKQRKKTKESFTNEIRSNSNIARFVTRLFEVKSFGIYNSDYPQRMPRGQMIATIYIKKSEKIKKDTLILKKLYMVEENKNILYTLKPSSTLSYNSNSKCVLWGVTNKDKLVVLKSEEFEKIPLNYKGVYNLEFEVIEKDLFAEEQIKKELDIDALF